MRGRVAIETQGCKLNQADSEALARRFLSDGYHVVGPEEQADVYVLNTCTVTHVADSKARQALNALRSAHPDALLVAAGCYAQRRPQELAALPGVELVVGNRDKDRLVELVLSRPGGVAVREQLSAPPPSGVVIDASPFRLRWGNQLPKEALGRTRAMVKIQEGCNQVCAYCIVPKVRGRERSVPPEEVVRQVRERAAEGYQEVVLTGTQLGSYGFDMEGASLERLIARVLSETAIPRLRVSSIQPQELTPGLLALWSEPRLCPHFHIPLQSGAAAVLQRMRRRYTPSDYARAVEQVRSAAPHASITSDVIVGFPAESEDEHQESLRLCQEMDFAAMHVFPFSARPGTSAMHLEPKVDGATKVRRAKEVLALAREMADSYRRRAVGQTRPVLWERLDSWHGESALSGLTDTYLRVFTSPDGQRGNRITPTRLVAARDGALWGEPPA